MTEVETEVAQLVQLFRDDSRAPFGESLNAEARIREMGASVIQALAVHLAGGDRGIRTRVATLLALMKDRTAVPFLIGALADGDAYVRMAVCDSLRRLRDVRAVPALVRALQDPDDVVRKNVATTLVRIKRTKAVDFTGPLLNDENALVREHACWLLADLNHVSTFAFLVAAMQDEYSDVRRAAVNGLGGLPLDLVEEHLARACQDPRVGLLAETILRFQRGRTQ